MRFTYAIKFVADMDRAIAFHRDTLGLELKFAVAVLERVRDRRDDARAARRVRRNPAGSVQLGFATDDLREFYDRRDELGLSFTQEPTEMHGIYIARFRDVDGAETSVSGPV